MFVDEAKIYVKGGAGGNGCNSFYRDKFNRRGRPDGGPGGNGGDVVFEADENIQTLLDFQYRQHLEAASGGHGSSNHKKGRRGEDLRVKVPPGTIIRDATTGLVLRELIDRGSFIEVAKGGYGGRGNSKDRPNEKGGPGEERTLVLELKLIADVGIIGYPNAGKSTFISKISSARPKIANYPFTTKEPVLGAVRIADAAGFVAAEIPGLIEGAHAGKGLGDRFLRHAERTKVLVHIVDIAAVEGREPVGDYRKLNKELKAYSNDLAKRPQIIALNKSDLPAAAENLRKFKTAFPRKKVYPISALTGDGLAHLAMNIYKKLESLKRPLR
jgi:GTP-binding protein